MADNTDGSSGEWETILDVDELNRTEGRNYQLSAYFLESRIFGPNASRVLLSLSDGGSDVSELREFDIEHRKFVPDGFRTGEGRFQVAWLDLDHILISHTLNGPIADSNWPTTTYIWKRGTDLKQAKPVFTMAATDALTILCPMGPTDSGRAVIVHAVDF